MSSGPTYADILDLTRRVQKDLADAQAKLVTITSWLAAQPTAKRTYEHTCRHCGFECMTANRLLEHLRNVHGEEPEVD